MKTYPVDIYGYRRIGENECSITLHTTVEVNSDDIKFFDDHRGVQSFLTVSDVPVGIDVPDLDIDELKSSMVENEVYDKDITPSERQRRKIWVLLNKKLDRKPTEEEFKDFYLEMMNKFDSWLREKIEQYDS